MREKCQKRKMKKGVDICTLCRYNNIRSLALAMSHRRQLHMGV